jgi:hypothetical protein
MVVVMVVVVEVEVVVAVVVVVVGVAKFRKVRVVHIHQWSRVGGSAWCTCSARRADACTCHIPPAPLDCSQAHG